MTKKELVRSMTLEEKAKLCSGKDFWHMNGVERLSVPSVMVTDGPHGLRKQAAAADHLGLNESVPATCFPPACLSACSWDSALLEEEGRAMGEECVEEEVAVLLGPGANLKRSPLCGRNFEYFSEDPLLSGKLAAALIRGVESTGTGTSLKHYAANSQEKARLSSNSVIDERALRELYLSGFGIAVREGRPSTLMCSYNRINGTYASENELTLKTVLREEWGFEGIVMTDWGAMNERVPGLKAGLELEMPGPAPENTDAIVKAVQDGSLEEEVLDTACEKLLSLILRASGRERKAYDRKAHHETARRIAAGSMVLLENDGSLPLSKEGKYEVCGHFAKAPRYQGAGSSRINPNSLDNAWDELLRRGYDVEYAEGCREDGSTDDELVSEAVRLSEGKDAVILFLGLPGSYESEGFDRSSLDLPEGHNRLAEALVSAGAKVIAVLYLGAPVIIPWRKKVSALLLGYLPGEAAGSSTVDVLTGEANPSGKLGETFPLSLSDTPCHGNFGGEGADVLYKESILAGYRYYDWAGKEVAYPFGYGLSYTTFAYSGLKATDKEAVLTVTNTGDRDGAETVQVYAGKSDSKIFRPVRELKGFKKVFLHKGESKTVSIPLESLAYYDPGYGRWNVEAGTYEIYIGASSRDLRLKAEITVEGSEPSGFPGLRSYTKEAIEKGISDELFSTLFPGPLPLTPEEEGISLNSRVSKALSTPGGRKLLSPILEKMTGSMGEDDLSLMMKAMLLDMPLRGLTTFSPELSKSFIQGLVESINRENA